MSPAFWADVLVVFHTAYVGFVVLGQLLILIGLVRGWQWIRNPWFRGLHLAAILVVAVEAYYGITCPLTRWELDLRAQAGQHVDQGSFVGRLFHNLLFWEDVDGALLRKVHMGFGLLVLLTFVLAPPRFRRGAAATTPAVPGAGRAAAAS